jgi:hypothetical protein
LAIENLKEWLFLALVVFNLNFWFGFILPAPPPPSKKKKKKAT